VLFLEKGRRSLLEFLVPIVKAEFEKGLDNFVEEAEKANAKRIEGTGKHSKSPPHMPTYY